MRIKSRPAIIIILCCIIAAALTLSSYRILKAHTSEQPNPNVTVVTAPDQDGFELHPEWGGAPVSTNDYGTNLAKGATVTDNGHTDVYTVSNAVDGDPTTYWEGDAAQLPNEVVITLKETAEIGGIQIRLNPDPIWGARTQEIEIQISTDGESFTTVSAKAGQVFDPDSGNCVFITLEPAQAQYIKVLFHSNTGAGGGQASEIEVYAP